MWKTLTEPQRRLLLGTGVGAGGFLITRLMKNPAPLDVLLISLLPALAVGLSAVALVLIYRTVRIINWAQIAMGLIAGQLFYEFIAQEILPFPVALAIGLLAGPLMGAIIGILFSSLFYRHPRLVLTVGTILVVGLVGYIFGRIDGAFHPDGDTRTNPPLLGPWPDWFITIGRTPFRTVHFVLFGIFVLTALGLVVFFRRTRVGTAVRASAENADRASLLGINVKMLQVGVWTIAGFISGVAFIGQMPVVSYTPGVTQDFTQLLFPLAAMVTARMQSMPVAFFTGIGLMLMRQAVQYSLSDPTFIDISLLGVIMVGLLAQRRKILSRAEDSSTWKAVKEVRPTPREMLRLPVIARTRRVFIFLGLVVALSFPHLVGSGTIASWSSLWTMSIVLISLVILVGWTGQISLGQFALVAIGAYVGGWISTETPLSFWLAVPIAGLAGALVAFLIGLPALRIRGLFLAVSTFAFAAVATTFLFDESFLGKWTPREVDAPTLFFIDFRDQKSMYYLLFVAFVVTAAGVMALRKSRAGRVLIALRDNEAGVQSFGINVVKTRLAAFAISGFIAAVGGALIVHQRLGLSEQEFPAAASSILVFILVVIGGVSSVSGAFLGALLFVVTTQWLAGSAALLNGVLGIAMLIFIPGGLAQIVYGARDAVLRVIALRQHLVVPSLFADYSPEAWEKQLTPLKPATQNQGLAALRSDQRYAMPTKVFGEAPA